MSRFRLFMLAMASFLAVVGESFFKKSIAVGLCGILTFNSASCWGNGVSAAIANQGELSPSSTEIAIPPRIRPTPVDLQDALADDFGIVSQNPFSTGRNEILFTSPSTGVEQKYSVNLPGKGDFQLFDVEFNKVSVPNPEKLVGSGNSIFTADQIAHLLESFQINFQNNQPSEVIFADGSKAEFSNSSYVFKLPSGEVVDSVTLSQGNLPDGNGMASKARIINSKYGSYNYLAQSENSCKSTVRNELNSVSKDISGIEDLLKSIDAETKELARWALAFGGEAVENSTVVTGKSTREENIDAAYCRLPVECGQVQNYEGGSEIRTNLFHLQPGTNRTVNLDYEFYTVPDRLEIYYNGEIRHSIPEPTETLVDTKNPPPGFLTNGNGRKTLSIDDGVEYVGVKVIGNYEIKTTKWNYQISCSGEAIADAEVEVICPTNNQNSLFRNIYNSQLNIANNKDYHKKQSEEVCVSEPSKIINIERWWTTAIKNSTNLFPVTLNLDITEGRPYLLTLSGNVWKVKRDAKVLIDGKDEQIQIMGKTDYTVKLGYLSPGKHKIKIDSFLVPQKPTVSKVSFALWTPVDTTHSTIHKSYFSSYFIADNPEPDQSVNPELLAKKYAPILYFDKGNSGVDKNIEAEQYLSPVAVETTYESLNQTNDIYDSILLDGKASETELELFTGDADHSLDINTSPQSVSEDKKVIYASVVQNEKKEIAINYYFYYPNSNWKDHDGHNNHDGDWEGITVFLDSAKNPIKVAYSQHVIIEKLVKQLSSGGQVVPWEFVDKDGNHPKVYVGLGGHASYPFPGLTGWGDPDTYGAGSPNIEFHKGDLSNFKPNNNQVKYLPHAESLNLKHKFGWLLYPGRWGKNGETPPRGPMFQSPFYKNKDDILLGDIAEGHRWLNPWEWSKELDHFKSGMNDFSTLVNQKIYIGSKTEDTIPLIGDERSILRGGDGNDIYQVYRKNYFIEDTDGNDTLKLFQKELYTYPLPSNYCDTTCPEGSGYRYEETSIDVQKINQGIMGLEKDGNNLIIDVNKDGVASYLDDLIIVDFFDDSGTGEGKGFIEKVAQLKEEKDRQEIIKLFQ